MGGLFSGTKTTKTTETTDTGPSKFQQPYLDTAFKGAQDAYTKAQGTPFYQGQLYAGMTDQQRQNLGSMSDYAMGQGMSGANALSGLGQNYLGYADKAGAALDKYGQLASGDATAANIAAAGQYADNPYINGQIDAVNRDVSRSLREDTLPGLDRAAAGSGNMGSTRAGVAAGIAQRGAADRMADNAASIRGAAYSQGLGLAQNDRAQQLAAQGNLASAYSGMVGQGISAIGAGSAAAGNAFGMANQAGALGQADRQGQLDADYQQWQGQDQRANDLLNRYYGVVGSNSWGQYGTGTTSKSEPTGGLFGSLLGAATGGLGLASAFTGQSPLAITKSLGKSLGIGGKKAG